MSEDLRRWITSELHDELGQTLTALQTRIRLAERKGGAGADLRAAWTLITAMRQTVSGLMATLRPAGLDAFGLESALRSGAIRELVDAAGLAYHVAIDDPHALLAQLDDHTRTALYRIVQEAATNAVRHARASRLHVRLRARSIGHRIRIGLVISDDGRGMATATQQPHTSGIGLQGIRDRMLVLGGRLRIHSDSRGTTLVAVLVLPGP